MDFGNAIETVASEEMAVDVALIGGGYMAPELVQYIIEERAGRDLPNEAYGATVVAGGALYGGAGRKVAIGGAVNVLEEVRSRVAGGN
jgi:hypothetical protein